MNIISFKTQPEKVKALDWRQFSNETLIRKDDNTAVSFNGKLKLKFPVLWTLKKNAALSFKTEIKDKGISKAKEQK